MYLVVGALGQLGSELRLILGNNAEYIDREDLDITDEEAVKKFFSHRKYDAVINCAAYTAVDKAEDDIENVRKINVDGPKFLAKSGMTIVHVSTDYVFDGNNCRPYDETDATDPQSVYGISKLDGENAVLENAKTALIIRTAWLYSIYGNNFVKTMRRLGVEKESLNVVFDQIGTPTYAKDLAQMIVDVLPRVKTGSKEIYNFSNEGVCSWYDFATEIMKQSNLACHVNPIESKDYPTPAKRPFYSVLNKSKIKNSFSVKINHWTVALADCLESMK